MPESKSYNFSRFAEFSNFCVKPLSFTLLRRLSDGKFHSGESLAGQLNLSRASVWKALEGLDETGLSLYRVRGRGYRLAEPIQWLDKAEILAHLGAQAGFFELEMLDCAESTNTWLMQQAASGAPNASVVITELQTRGRGRRGREWRSGLGGALTFSLLWRFNQGAGFLSGLSLAVGVALIRALKSSGLQDIRLKWPNDVLFQHAKLGGILCEIQGDMLGPSAAVIGIGLNLKLADSVKAGISQAVTDIATISGAMPDRNRLFAALLLELAGVLSEFESHGFAPFRDEWTSHHACQNQPVKLLLPDGSRQDGVVRGVTDDGSLLLQTRTGKRSFNSGEISLRI